jgi:hypothetical protein
MGKARFAYRFLVGKPLGKCTFTRPRSRREHNIKIFLRNMDCKDGRWILAY